MKRLFCCLLASFASFIPELSRGASVVTNWSGISNLNYTQVDPHGAAGPNGILELANVTFTYRTKAGVTLWATNEQAFFLPTVCCDAKALYDVGSQRFFIIAQDNDATNLHVAVSRSSNPASGSTNDWFRFKFPTGIQIDYPGIGIDGQALYVSYGKQNHFWAAINKSHIIAGTNNASTARLVTNIVNGPFINNFALQAVSVIGSSSPGDVAYAVTTDQNTGKIILYAITNVLGTQSFFTTNFAGPAAGTPANDPLAPQNGVTNRLIDAANVVMGNAFWRGGELWFCSSVVVTNQPARTVIRYYKLKTGGFPNGQVTLDEWGDLDGGSNTWCLHPAISGNARGDVCLVYAVTSSNTFNTIYSSIRKAGETNFATVAIKTSIASWTQSINWADYCVVTPDPMDQTFWVADLTVQATNSVTMWWGNIARDNLLFVDKNAAGTQLGTRELPYHTIRNAHTAVTGAKTLVITPASYPEPTLPLRLDKNVRLENPYPSGTVHIGP